MYSNVTIKDFQSLEATVTALVAENRALDEIYKKLAERSNFLLHENNNLKAQKNELENKVKRLEKLEEEDTENDNDMQFSNDEDEDPKKVTRAAKSMMNVHKKNRNDGPGGSMQQKSSQNNEGKVLDSNNKTSEVKTNTKTRKHAPAIKSYNINVKLITSDLKKILNHNNFSLKLANKNMTVIIVFSYEDHCKVVSHLQKLKYKYYTYTPVEAKPYTINSVFQKHTMRRKPHNGRSKNPKGAPSEVRKLLHRRPCGQRQKMSSPSAIRKQTKKKTAASRDIKSCEWCFLLGLFQAEKQTQCALQAFETLDVEYKKHLGKDFLSCLQLVASFKEEYNKIQDKEDKTRAFIFLNTHKPDVLLLAEHKLSPKHKIAFDNYTIYRQKRQNARGGGTAHRTYGCQAKATELTVAALYQKPKKSLLSNDLDQLESLNADGEIVMGADLNAKHTAWGGTEINTKGRKLHDWVTNSANPLSANRNVTSVDIDQAIDHINLAFKCTHQSRKSELETGL
uniref:Endonuclease/exonuclease/phosphatase domain-containing protein n=1 Tax=Glossina palpalis gambiensis TaxID=67801 RepID=A0A1B0BL26_9MUSC